MLTAHCVVRDYDPLTDTVSVELVGGGIIDTWIDGIAVGPHLSRAFLTGAVDGTIAMPDLHRICEATLIAVNNGSPTTATGTGTQKTQQGRGTFACNASGVASQNIVFPSAYTVAPTVSALPDGRITITLSGITTTGFTAGMNNPAYAGKTVLYTWTATGV